MFAVSFWFGEMRKNVGERWSIVTCAGVLGDVRDERRRGRTRADHDDALAGEVEVLRPALGVHHGALEALEAGPLRRVALLVAVVALAHP